MNKQLQFRTLTTTILTAILVATLAFVPLTHQQVFAGNPNVTFCHFDGEDGWIVENASFNGWENGHELKHFDGTYYDFLIVDNDTEQLCDQLINGVPFDGFKTWTHTDYNWDSVCDEPSVKVGELCVFPDESTELPRPANINNNGEDGDPDDDVLADSLDPDDQGISDGISDVQVKVKRNGEISNMIPGAIYALTTVNVLTDLDMLEVDENYGDCTDTELELLNQNNLSRNVKVAVADPNGDVTEVTDRLYDELDLGVVLVGIDDSLATVKINDANLLTNGSTVFVLVKFDDKLKGIDYDSINGGEPFSCLNDEMVTSIIGEEDPFGLTFEAELRFTEAS